MTYLDMWRSGTFLLYSLSESKKRRQDCLMLSAQSFYGPCLQSVAHSLAVFPGIIIIILNVPLLHTSKYITLRDSVLPGLSPRYCKQQTLG